MWVSLRGLPKIKSKTIYLLWPIAVHAHIKGTVWLKFCEYQPHPPTLCLHAKPYVHGVERHTHAHTQRERNIDTYSSMLHIWRISYCISTNMQITNARTAKGADAKRMSPWAVWELFWDLCSPPWVFCLSREGRSLFCGGRFSSRINEKLHLSHEKSIFTIYLTSCIPKAHIRRCWLTLAYSSVFLMHSLPLLWSSVGRLPPLQPCPLSLLHFSCLLSENSFFSAEMKYGTQLDVWGSYWRNERNKASQDLSVLFG